MKFIYLGVLACSYFGTVSSINNRKPTYNGATPKTHLSPPKADVSVSKESLVEYSPRDPLYTDETKPVPKVTKINKRLGHDYGPPPASYYPASHDPEPIIEIIIKDSNETLPPPPPPAAVYTPKPTKEPVQVFYVKYKKNPNSYGKEDEIIYEPPIPALTPPTNNHDLESEHPSTPSHTLVYTTPAPRPSTTLRTIIRPDSEIYHGTGGVKVTFGKTEIHPAPILSHREDTSSSSSNVGDHISKRDSHTASSDLQPVRRNPEYRSPILNQNEFQALPPSEFNKPNNFNAPFRGPPNDFVPNNNINEFSSPVKKGPNDYTPLRNGPNQFAPPNNGFGLRPNNEFSGNGPVRNGPNYENKGHNFNAPVRTGQSFDVPFKNGPQNFELPIRNGLDGPVRNGPNFDGPIRNGPNFDTPVRPGHSFDGPVRSTPNNFDAPPNIRNGPNFDGPLRNGPNVDGPSRYSPNNYNKPSNDLTLQQSSNSFSNRPNALSKVAFPQTVPPQFNQRPLDSNQLSQSSFSKPPPNQPLQAHYQQPLNQQKPFIPSQPIYSQQELIQPPSQYQQNTYIQHHTEPSSKYQTPNPYQQQQTLKTPPMQQFGTNEAIRKPQQLSNYENTFGNKLQPFEQPLQHQHYVQEKPSNRAPVESNTFQDQQSYTKHHPFGPDKPTRPSSITQHDTFQEQFNKQNSVDEKIRDQLKEQQALEQQQKYLQQLVNSQKQTTTNVQQNIPASFQTQHQQIVFNRPSINVEDQNNLFVNHQGDLNSFKPGTELSNEEYQLLLEKQRLQQLSQLHKDKQQSSYQNSNTNYQQTQSIYQQQKDSPSQRQQYQNQQQVEIQHQIRHPSTQQYQSNKETNHYHSKPSTTKYISSSPSTVKYQHVSVTSTPAATTLHSTTTSPLEVSTEFSKEQKEKYNKNLLALPDEVPEDLRKQLLSSGILGNADIQILDYDKVGDIPIESLPPEALANFYNSGGGAQTIKKRSADFGASASEESKQVEMKVVKFDPATDEGQKIAESYIQGQGGPADATLDPVVLNDATYNRYLPLKVNGASFPLPPSDLLKNRKVTSVVVLAPVDYEAIVDDVPASPSQPLPNTPHPVTTQGDVQTHDHRDGKALKVAGVHFVSGSTLNDLLKDPTEENYKNWLRTEKEFPVNRQSILLLVTTPQNETTGGEFNKEVYMYDFNSENINELKGDLSETFLQVAESNASSEELDNISSDDENDASRTSTNSSNEKDVTKNGERQSAAIVESTSSAPSVGLKDSSTNVKTQS